MRIQRSCAKFSPKIQSNPLPLTKKIVRHHRNQSEVSTGASALWWGWQGFGAAYSALIALGLFKRKDIPFPGKALVWSLAGIITLCLGFSLRAPLLVVAGICHGVVLAVDGTAEVCAHLFRAISFRRHDQWFNFMTITLGAKSVNYYRTQKRCALAIWNQVSSPLSAPLLAQLREIKSNPQGKEHAEAKIETLTERIIGEQKEILGKAFQAHLQRGWINRLIFYFVPTQMVAGVSVICRGSEVNISVGVEMFSVEKIIGRRIHLGEDVSQVMEKYKGEISVFSEKFERDLIAHMLHGNTRI